MAGRFGIAKLNGANWPVWELRVDALLAVEDIWEVVFEEAPEADQRDAAWKSCDRKAKEIILSLLEDRQRALVTGKSHARDVFCTLKGHHEEVLRSGDLEQRGKARRCFRCGQAGHFKRNCPQDGSREESGSVSEKDAARNTQVKATGNTAAEVARGVVMEFAGSSAMKITRDTAKVAGNVATESTGSKTVTSVVTGIKASRSTLKATTKTAGTTADIVGETAVEVAGKTAMEIVGTTVVKTAGMTADIVGKMVVEVAGKTAMEIVGTTADIVRETAVEVAGKTAMEIVGETAVEVAGKTAMEIVGTMVVKAAGTTALVIARKTAAEIVVNSVQKIAGTKTMVIVGNAAGGAAEEFAETADCTVITFVGSAAMKSAGATTVETAKTSGKSSVEIVNESAKKIVEQTAESAVAEATMEFTGSAARRIVGKVQTAVGTTIEGIWSTSAKCVGSVMTQIAESKLAETDGATVVGSTVSSARRGVDSATLEISGGMSGQIAECTAMKVIGSKVAKATGGTVLDIVGSTTMMSAKCLAEIAESVASEIV